MFWNRKLKKAADHWNNVSRNASSERLRWWQHPDILKHINQRVCGDPVPGLSGGFNRKLKARIGEKPLGLGISVGCGNGTKELNMIAAGIVEHFHLFEISEVRVEQGLELARKRGLADHITFHLEDAFERDVAETYDLIHWNNSLHHMLDVDQAIAWSRQILKPGGFFALDDFVGPSRFQWSDFNLEVASRVRQILPDKYLRDPRKPDALLPKQLNRPNIKKFIEADPTEAADSSRILECLQKYFPDADITLTGGAIYFIGMSDVLANLDDEEDAFVLELLLLIDDLCIQLGETPYATAIADKH